MDGACHAATIWTSGPRVTEQKVVIYFTLSMQSSAGQVGNVFVSFKSVDLDLCHDINKTTVSVKLKIFQCIPTVSEMWSFVILYMSFMFQLLLSEVYEWACMLMCKPEAADCLMLCLLTDELHLFKTWEKCQMLIDVTEFNLIVILIQDLFILWLKSLK